MIELTESAIQKVIELGKSQNPQEQYLRIFVSEGGCSGMEYGMKLDVKRDNDISVGDERYQVIVDPVSMEKIKGSIVTFDDGLHGSGFSVKNPNAKETCGCGRSFS